MNALEIPTDVERDPPALLNWANRLVISTQDDYEDAADGLKLVKLAGKKITDFFRPLKQKVDESKRALLDAERKLLGPLDQAEIKAKHAMLVWQKAQDAARQEEQRKLQSAVDERARVQRETLEFEAAFSTDQQLKAQAAAEAARVVAPLVTVPEAPKVAGVQTRKTWKCRVVNADLIPRDFLMIDQKKLDAYARAMREAAKVPGAEFWAEESLAVRSAQ